MFWESLNFACLKNISLLFVCEDNNLAIHSKSSERHGYRSITDIIDRFDCHVIQSESTDPEVIADLTTQGITHSLEKGGPVFFHFKCYRYLEHVGINEDFQFGYRSRDKFKRWQTIDPISIQRKKLLENGHHESSIRKIEREIIEQIEQSILQASRAPFPPDTDLYQNVLV